MGEIYLSKDIILPIEEDGDSIFLGRIKLEDLQSESLTRQLEQKCDSLLKQNFIKESESEVGLDELLDSVNIVEDELDRGFSRELGISEVFWKKVLKLLSFINEVFCLNLDLKLTDELVLTKEKQKRKNLLFSFLDAIRKKFFKKELTLEEMLELQIKALEEQLGSENDPEVVHQIKKQLEFLMELKVKLFELSLEQGLNRTMEWLFTIGAMQTVAEMARGSYKSKEIAATKGQWQKVDNLSNSGKFVRQVGNTTCNSRDVESVKTKPFTSTDQNNNFNLMPLPQNIAKDGSGFLKLLYTLLLLANAYAAKHMELAMGGDREAEIHKATQKGSTAGKTNDQTQRQIPVGQDRRERKKLSTYDRSQDVKLQTPEKQDVSQKPNSLLQEANIRQSGVDQSTICEKSW